MRRFSIVVAVVVAVLLAACGGRDDSPAASPGSLAGGSPTSAGDAPARVSLVEAFGGRSFDRPTELGVYPGDRFFIAD